MKTFTQLKKDLGAGVKIKVLYHSFRPEQEGHIKTITKTQTNGLYTTCPDDRDGKELWLDYPPSATLIEYDDNIFTFYDAGTRDLTDLEQEFLRQQKKAWDDYPYDNPYYTSLSIAKKLGVEYMVTSSATKRFDHNTQKVQDATARGEKLLSFEILEG